MIKVTKTSIVIPDTADQSPEKLGEAEVTIQPSVSVKHSDVFHVVEDEDTSGVGEADAVLLEENDPFDKAVGTLEVLNVVEDEDQTS